MKGKPLNLDWESLELEYVQGNSSLKQIADKYQISWGALRSRANRFKWNRKSASSIIEQSREKIVQSLTEKRLKLIEEVQNETVPIARKIYKGVETTIDDLHGQPMEPSQLQGLAMALKTSNLVALTNLGWVQQTAVDVTSGGLSAHESAIQIMESAKAALKQGFDPSTIDVDAVCKMIEDDQKSRA